MFLSNLRSIEPVFDKTVACATTVNSLNAILIRFENRMGPDEEEVLFHHILGYPIDAHPARHYLTAALLKAGMLSRIRSDTFSHLAPDIREHLYRWAHSLWQHSRMAGLQRKPGLRRQWHRAEASFFRHDDGPDRIIVALGGGFGRFGMRTPTLMRFLDVANADVLLLRPRNHKDYSEGVAGLGSSFVEVIDTVAELASSYSSIIVTGISKGSLGSVVLGGALRASRIVVVGLSKLPEGTLVSGLAADELQQDQLEEAWETARQSIDTAIIYGSDAPRDRVASQQLHQQMDRSTLIEVAHSPHAVLWPLAQRGELRETLKKWFSIESLQHGIREVQK